MPLNASTGLMLLYRVDSKVFIAYMEILGDRGKSVQKLKKPDFRIAKNFFFEIKVNLPYLFKNSFKRLRIICFSEKNFHPNFSIRQNKSVLVVEPQGW